MADGKSSEGLFPFFDLPAELQDMIYNNLRQVVKVSDKSKNYGKHFHTFVYALAPHVRLVIHQFKEEAENRIKKQTLLVMEDYSLELMHSPPPLHSWITENTTHVMVILMACCDAAAVDGSCEESCPAGFDVEMHKAWIERLLPNLPRAITLHVDLTIRCAFDDQHCWPKAAHAPNLTNLLHDFVKMDRLTTLVVNKDLGHTENRWATWESEKGWQASEVLHSDKA